MYYVCYTADAFSITKIPKPGAVVLAREEDYHIAKGKACQMARAGGIMVDIGKYKHFKGNDYCVIGTATHANTKDLMVLYKDEQETMWVRPMSEFFDDVSDREDNVTGQKMRFEKNA